MSNVIRENVSWVVSYPTKLPPSSLFRFLIALDLWRHSECMESFPSRQQLACVFRLLLKYSQVITDPLHSGSNKLSLPWPYKGPLESSVQNIADAQKNGEHLPVANNVSHSSTLLIFNVSIQAPPSQQFHQYVSLSATETHDMLIIQLPKCSYTLLKNAQHFSTKNNTIPLGIRTFSPLATLHLLHF